ncbi:hypothetical protein [Tenuifilum thalassicum]|uniref:Uncharacterized protein n=1 Tax=Tenuifilum thalassicum TaxID=2590900 RepID=A0A7D3XJC5_9BACT|nr:hypothetical protein [Tenuifilum thalassicum]QKG78730.1 hypothetical protein FHG85_00090 [Tenuifilum thalassicum]
MKHKIFLLLCFQWLLVLTSLGQRDIEPRLLFSDTANFSFTGEWQYLSTDIFLFNGDKFSTLINELDFARTEPRRRWRKKRSLETEQLEYLFITASLKNVKFFGDNDITYPLYNFQISRDKENKYQTFVSDNIDHVRIIDNLPLYSARDFIDAEIRVKAITKNDRDQVLSLVASQLKNLSKITTPTDAVMSIIGEFGNFIESNTKKKEYHFSSTIRLFEQKNFDTRLHSIKLYLLTTANTPPVDFSNSELRNFLDTVNLGFVNRNQLRKLISIKDYPVIVVANYKSLYRTVQISGDEVTFANIEKRKIKVETDFRQGLINAETYRQEKDLLGFLNIFAQLKNHLDVYKLNYRTGNNDAISVSLFRVMQYYRQLLKAYDEIKFKYQGNNTFTTIFKREYESILGFASLYLDDDPNLKSTKDLVNTTVSLEANPNIDDSALEKTISILRFSNVFKPELMQQNLEGKIIQNHIQILEEKLFKIQFEPEIEKLRNTEANEKNKSVIDSLLRLTRSTSCGLCREQALNAITDFNAKLDKYYLNLELQKFDSLVQVLQPWIFQKLETIQLMKDNFNTLYPNNQNLESAKYLYGKIAEIERDVKNLNDFIKVDLTGKELPIVKQLNDKLININRQVESKHQLVCKLRPELCSKQIKQPVVMDSNNFEKLFERSDSVARQAAIFHSIFSFKVNRALKDDSLNISKKLEIDKLIKQLDELEVAIKLIDSKEITNDEYNNLSQQINNQIKAISDKIFELEL